MKFRPASFTLLSVALALSGCASSGKLRSDYDREADFGQYRTYNFIDHSGEQEYESLFHKYMVEAITLEMEKRGYRKSAEPDLLVNFNANLQDKTQVRTTSAPPPMYGYYGYRGGYYGAWGGYPYGTETYVSQYTEGTFNIDLIDARRKQLVWEAVGIGRVSDSVRENLEQRVKEGVPKFFALYPFVAGDPNPQGGK
ncbi:MAG: DUF4136 domain-containing protein [Gammaproteobacteria bacterium]|nr:DUF4136 domain-containing protein [Gammaproteobacteria bacterium]MDH5345461.1 DUF4136 domain-containing protein [Gammaproteobacteria bacterium]